MVQSRLRALAFAAEPAADAAAAAAEGAQGLAQVAPPPAARAAARVGAASLDSRFLTPALLQQLMPAMRA